MLDIYTVVLIGISAAFIAILIAIVVFMGYLRKILSIASFMSPNATIFAIGPKYTKMDELEKLLEMSSVTEVIGNIRKEGYRVESLEKADIEIEREMLRMLDEVISMLPEGIRQFAEVYMLKFDAEIVKRILRAKKMGISKNEIYQAVYEGKYVSSLIINHMVEAMSVEDAIAALDATPFSSVIGIFGESGNLYDVDVALDRIFFEKIMEARNNLDEDSREAVEKLLGMMIDVYNLKVLVRGKMVDVNVEKHFVDGGYELSVWKLKSLAESRTLEELLANMEGTSYSFLREVESAFEAEIALDRFLLEKANEMSLVYSTSSGPAMMFLIAKEYEARNLKVIIKGFKEAIEKEKIANLLVGVAS